MLFRYPGAKSKKVALMQIKSLFPDSFREYREPFVGGGSVFLSIDPSIKRWVNDLNRPLVSVYEALKSRPKELLELCRSIAPATPDEPCEIKASGARYPTRMLAKFQELLRDEDADPALRYTFVNRCAWNGRVRLDPTWRHRTYFSNPKGWNESFFGALADAAEKLADATITCSDFEAVFDEPGDDVLIFADPPYVKDTLLPNSGKLYEHGFSDADHRRLADCVRRCAHRVILSYDDHPLVRDLYKEQFIHEASWTYTGRRDRPKGRELLITNYPPPNAWTMAAVEQSKESERFEYLPQVRTDTVPTVAAA